MNGFADELGPALHAIHSIGLDRLPSWTHWLLAKLHVRLSRSPVSLLRIAIDTSQYAIRPSRQTQAVQLKKRYEQLFGEPCHSCNKIYLVRRIAWRLQANAEGGLSERAKRRIEELADDAEIRLTPPKNAKPKVSTVGTKSPLLATGRDKRLPPPGLCIQRVYKDRIIQVIVLADGFEFDGKKYKSLSAIAKSITGSHVNGFHFFQLGDAK